MELITFLYTFLVISFSQYKRYMICLIPFRVFSDALPAFTCTNIIDNLWRICLGVNIWIHVPKSEERPLPFCYLLKSTISFLK